jgi:hypothetical protein
LLTIFVLAVFAVWGGAAGVGTVCGSTKLPKLGLQFFRGGEIGGCYVSIQTIAMPFPRPAARDMLLPRKLIDGDAV